jgi:hypothetical protein
MDSVTVKTIRRSIVALVGAISFAAIGGAAHASSVNTFTTDLDVDFSGPLDNNGTFLGTGAPLDGEIAGTAGIVTGLNSQNDTPGVFTASSPPSSAFAFNYTFTVSAPSNAQGSYASQLEAGVSNFSLNLFGPGATLVAGSTPSGGGSGGELVLNLADLTPGTTYDLVVSGNLVGGAAAFSGWATVSPVPLPGALLLFGSGLLGLGGFAGRGRLKTLVSRLSGQVGRAAALLMAIGIGLGLAFVAAPANASTIWTDIDSLGAIAPSPVAITINGFVNPKAAIPVAISQTAPFNQLGQPTSTGSGAFGSFVFDYTFSLANPAATVSYVSQKNTLVNAGSDFELFSGTPGSGTLVEPSTLTGPGELSLAAANLAAGSYFLQIVGALSGTAHGILTGQLQVSAVPLPAALLLFGSGLAGLMGFGRFKRKDSASA